MENVYGYLCPRGRIADASVSIFVDSGASFNAIDPQVALALRLPIKTEPKPLQVKLGAGQRMSIPRRTTKIKLSMDGFPTFTTDAFVMDIPEGKNLLLVFPWLEDIKSFYPVDQQQVLHGHLAHAHNRVRSLLVDDGKFPHRAAQMIKSTN
ncbi:Enzymatic Polyprotein-like [Phytophthora palmivora]|uniref:Enzymatic Polyprotein-like n=1 Tax=Phytophthora palmivora TaxID=4796 RepID=A0A2P4X5Q5_9STRA|nr:Enzymatic Polyprotein-like [Phytophthora palmivora]